MTAKHLKGEYNLNPTSMVMKSGSEQAREAQRPVKEYVRGKNPAVKEAHQVSADTCTECADMTHPAMQTRHSHPRNIKHTDGRVHEDDHHAVRKMKGMM